MLSSLIELGTFAQLKKLKPLIISLLKTKNGNF